MKNQLALVQSLAAGNGPFLSRWYQQSYRDTVDQAVDMFDKLLLKTHIRAQNELDEQMRSQRQTIQSSLATLKTLAEIILDDAVTNDELRSQVFERVSKAELAARVEELDEWVCGKKGLFHGIVKRYGTLRKFSPAFLHALEFVQDAEGEDNTCPQCQDSCRLC